MQHLDEGTIHAWLDDALTPDESAAVALHASACQECAARVAEARGLIAASSRILSALDVVPAGVVPDAPPVAPSVVPLGSARRPKRWGQSAGFAAAAGIMFLAATSLFLVQRAGDDVTVREALPVTADAPAAPAPAADQVRARAKSALSDASTRDDAADTIAKQAIPANPVREPERALGQRAQELEPRAGAPPAARPAPATELPRTTMAFSRIDTVPAVAPRPGLAAAASKERPESKVLADSSAVAAGGARSDVLSRRRADPATFVRGQVTDRTTGAPVGNAVVSVLGLSSSALTDSAGYFALPAVPAGRHELRVRRIGYGPGSSRLDVTPGDSLFVALSLDAAALSLNAVVATASAAAPRGAQGKAESDRSQARRASDSLRTFGSVRGNASITIPLELARCYRLGAVPAEEARQSEQVSTALSGVVRLDTTAIAERGVFAGFRAETIEGTNAGVARWRLVANGLLSLERDDGVVVALAIPRDRLAQSRELAANSPYAGTPRVLASPVDCPQR
jgi:hypothetical protein